MKKEIYIDFDGVLNQYTGWKGKAELFKPQKDVDLFLKKLSQDYEINIFSTRSCLDIADWLIKHNLREYISNITNVKEPAYAYIDDRAIRFDGDYSKVLSEIETFKPYWKEEITVE